MDKKATIIVGILIVLVLGAGFYLWNKQEDTTYMSDTDSEVMDANGSIPETRDLEAEFNASGTTADEDIQGLEAELEGNTVN